MACPLCRTCTALTWNGRATATRSTSSRQTGKYAGRAGFRRIYRYDNDQPAGNLWYHDHALGITRLNVYAGMAGFYIVRDDLDTGQPGNPLKLPAFPYEMGLAIQDRMFQKNGRLFYPAFPSDPFWEDFITGEGLENDEVPKPSALAEFFGDHMVVNGLIWPKADVEPRNYRLRLINGCDSRFLVYRFRAVPAGATDLSNAGAPLPFYVIGSDQGLASAATQTDTLVHEPGGRYDIIFDFKNLQGMRIIMENVGETPRLAVISAVNCPQTTCSPIAKPIASWRLM